MTTARVQAILICLWLASFALCLGVPLVLRRDAPENFHALIKQAFDTFGPGLATMLAFVFQPQRLTRANTASPLALWLAPLLAIVYVGFFDALMLTLVFGRGNAEEIVGLFQDYRPYLSFLVTGVLAYYFHQTRRTA
jgi:hypothetical protein